MTEEELRQRVNEIIQRTRNQETILYADFDMLVIYIDFLEFKQSRYEKSMDKIGNELGIKKDGQI